MRITPRLRPNTKTPLTMPSVYRGEKNSDPTSLNPNTSRDTVPAMLSPGEYVLSNQDMQHPLVKALVHHLSGMGGMPAGGPGPVKHFDTGGAVTDNQYSPWMAALGQGGNYGNLGTMFSGQLPVTGGAPPTLSGTPGYNPDAITNATQQMQQVTSQNGSGAYSPTGDPAVMNMLNNNALQTAYQQNRGSVNQLQALGMDDPMVRAGMLGAGSQAGMQGVVSTVGNAQANAAQSAQDFIRQALMGQYGQEQTNTRQTQQLNQQANEFGQNLDFQKQQWQQQQDLQNQQRSSSLWGQLGSALLSGGLGFLTGGPAGAVAGAAGGLNSSSAGGGGAWDILNPSNFGG